ncbi:MAG: type II toxin-antitoxin system VapC family toxin [Desulfobacteraceae bacterium]|nr:type II toxin-antitoxin system VapC family toxin [Desulfobacteraceae bacterium]MCP4350689.1 type II toxin-antitoxin system VapC family toxin [Desulfobacterales bacterium]
MKPVFVDTSALIAIGNRRDAFHSQAVKIKDELKKSGRNFVTTNAVLLEFGNAFSPVNLRPVAVKMIEAVRASKKWECVSTDDTLVERGFQKFRQIKDKDWGLVDCISIIVSKDIGITEIFTTDHHFEQAGFRILLKKTD